MALHDQKNAGHGTQPCSTLQEAGRACPSLGPRLSAQWRHCCGRGHHFQRGERSLFKALMWGTAAGVQDPRSGRACCCHGSVASPKPGPPEKLLAPLMRTPSPAGTGWRALCQDPCARFVCGTFRDVERRPSPGRGRGLDARERRSSERSQLCHPGEQPPSTSAPSETRPPASATRPLRRRLLPRPCDQLSRTTIVDSRDPKPETLNPKPGTDRLFGDPDGAAFRRARLRAAHHPRLHTAPRSAGEQRRGPAGPPFHFDVTKFTTQMLYFYLHEQSVQ